MKPKYMLDTNICITSGHDDALYHSIKFWWCQGFELEANVPTLADRETSGNMFNNA
jgi:hypothetical protein